jgi:hypothetical protein
MLQNQLPRTAAQQHFQNWFTMANAFAKFQEEKGVSAPRLTAANARDTYTKLMKTLSEVGNTTSTGHNAAFNALRSEIQDREAIGGVVSLAESIYRKGAAIANAAMQNGMSPEAAQAVAVNSIAGNPNYDHFANLNVMAEQLYEQKTFIASFIENGDAFALPVESGSTGSATSRFRAPVAQTTGSAKTYQGDVNPFGDSRHNDTNGIQVNFTNEFKDAKTEYATFIIDQAMRDQALGYAQAVSPALAGLVLQNLYTTAAMEYCMKNAELAFVDGQVPGASYERYVGGNYGLLSPNVILSLADAANASPMAATGSDWTANPTKLIQKIANFNYKPASITAQLPASADGALVYKDVVRLINLYAMTNVDVRPTSLTLYVPTSYYGFAVQYLGDLYTKQLDEAIRQATGGIVRKLEIKPSGLLGYRAANSVGAAQNNFFALVAHGAPNGKKGLIFPGQTVVPQISSENVSQQRMSFSAQYIHGGPMVMQTNQVFLLEFSVAA